MTGTLVDKRTSAPPNRQWLTPINPLKTTNSPAKSRISERDVKSKSLLVLFFRKEQESSFSEEKEAKRLLLFGRSH
jgi:hypothetical protein